MTRHTIFISGAAAGIGRATAIRFLSEGWRVGAYDVDTEQLATLGDAARVGGDQLVTGQLDVRDPDQWSAALHEFCGRDGTLDALVNNAGILLGEAFTATPLEQHHRQTEVNFNGVVNGAYLGHPYLLRAAKQSGRAHLVNMSSASAIYGQPELATYSATKFAVRGLTEALELEWAGDNIAVTAVWPFYVNTSLIDGVDIASVRNLGVRLTPDDVAQVVWQACTSDTEPGAVLRPVHRGVGWLAKVMMAGSAVSPPQVARLVNRYVNSPSRPGS